MYKCDRGPDFQNITSKPRHNHSQTISSFMTNHWVCNNSNTMVREIPTLPMHPSSSRLLFEFVLLSFTLSEYVLLIIACPFGLFILTALLYVPLFVNLRLLTTHLVSSNCSCITEKGPTLFGIRYSSVLQTGEIRSSTVK